MEPGIAAEIVENDKKDIDTATALLVYFDKPSVGTSMEILYAHQRGIPVYVVDQSSLRALSPWLVYHSTEIFLILSAAVEHINATHIR
jgi:nucleoside 2-deoxyribosyltransferase